MRTERHPPVSRWANPVVFEALEKRLLLSGDLPCIESVAADNRGQVVLVATDDLDETTISDASVLIFTAGADGLLGTADDVLADRVVSYDAETRSITVTAELGVDERYRLVLDSSIITNLGGAFLDGEFNGPDMVSGDGIEGGDYEMFTRPTASVTVRFTTIAGVIDVVLFSQQTPITVENFIEIANAAIWDNTFFHRLVDDFVLQGGGFEAVDEFPEIEGIDPILNEPGISNTRGTLAMAKRPGDPDSATNQWFFNIGDNSGNLDDQNGGFTVFGEIANEEGLAVLDALAAFMTVNASGQNSSFDDLPVLDPSVVDDNGGVATPDDVIVVSRIAVLMEVEGEPSDQLDASGAVVITNPNGDATVRVFDLDGVGLPSADQFIRVVFGRGDRIARIELLDGLPDGRVGIQINGATSTGAIIDRRTGGGGEVAFIVSDSAVSTINMREALTGENLNGIVLPGQVMDPDIDGDGDIDDRTALFVPEGVVSSFIGHDGLAGDVVAPKINNVRIRGLTADLDFTFDDPNFPVVRTPATNFFFDQVIDTNIRMNGDIGRLSAAEWLDNDGDQEAIRAESIRSLQIRGGAASSRNGDFEANVVTTGQDPFGISLRSAIIRGTVFGSVWDINGDVQRINIRGDASSWTANINGEVGPIVGGEMRNVNVSATGAIRAVNVRGWEGGTIEAQSMRTLATRRTAISAGNFEADVTLTGPAPTPGAPILHSLNVGGDLNNVTMDIEGGMRTIIVRGLTSSFDIDSTGFIQLISMGEVIESTLFLRGGMSILRASSWLGGGVSSNTIDDMRIVEFFEGDISANFIEKLSVLRGDLTTTMNVLRVIKIDVGGDLVNSTLNFNDNRTGAAPGIDFLVVRGEMRDTEVNASLDLGAITLGAMSGSNIHVGFDFDMVGFPDDASDLQFNSSIERFEIRGMGDGSATMLNSFVVAGRIGQFIISEPSSDNFGQPFGVAAGLIDSSMVTIDGQSITVSTAFNPSSESIGDFQVRFGFMPPVQV